MKKLIFNVCGAAIVAAALLFNLSANQISLESDSLISSVQIEAVAGSADCYQTWGRCGWHNSWKCTPTYTIDGACYQYYCETCANL